MCRISERFVHASSAHYRFTLRTPSSRRPPILRVANTIWRSHTDLMGVEPPLIGNRNTQNWLTSILYFTLASPQGMSLKCGLRARCYK